jgi:hypothetical protein
LNQWTEHVRQAANLKNVLTPNATIKDKLFGDMWMVIGPEVRDEITYYRIRNEQGEEITLADWAVRYFEVIEGGR